VLSVRDIDSHAKDSQILRWAVDQQRIVITMDGDQNLRIRCLLGKGWRVFTQSEGDIAADKKYVKKFSVATFNLRHYTFKWL